MEAKIHVNCKFTLEEIDKYLHSRSMPFDATLDQILEYWGKKNWLTTKGEKVATVSAAVNVVNSFVIQQKRKKGVVDFDKVYQRKNEESEWVNKKDPYYNQLSMDQWKAYREFIFSVRGKKCEVCGKPNKLNIHHKEYIKNRFAWEYLPNEVMVLCCDCHRYIHKIKTD